MKHKLLILFLFIAFAGHAQREILLDTLYITNEGGKVFIYTYTEFTDGSRKGNFSDGDYRKTAPDTATAVNFVEGEIRGKTRQYAAIAQQALQKKAVFDAVLTLDKAVVNFTGHGVLDSIKANLATMLIGTDWTYRTPTDATNRTAAIAYNANGVLKINLGGGVIRDVIPIAETWFRINNLSGVDTDFFLMPSGVFVSSEANMLRGYIIRKASIVQQVQSQGK